MKRAYPLTQTPIRVLIADDHPIITEGVQLRLEATGSIQVVGSTTRFAGIFPFLETTPVDVLILDLAGMHGAPLTIVERLQRDYPAIAIIVFSSSVDLAPELLGAGVLGYVLKEDLSHQLTLAVEAVFHKEQFLSPLVAEYLDQTRASTLSVRLSPQELLVVKLLAQGCGTDEIAEQLTIRPHSVQNNINRALRKVGCTRRSQLIDWYKRTYGV